MMNWLKSPMLRLGVLFAVWGPWLGSDFYFGYDSLFVKGVLTTWQTWSDLLIGTITLYPFSLIFGGLPALLAGSAYAFYLKTQTVKNPDWKKRLLIGAVLGGVFSLVFLLIFLGAKDASVWIMSGVAALTGAIGTLLLPEGAYFWLFPKRNPLYEQLQKQKSLKI